MSADILAAPFVRALGMAAEGSMVALPYDAEHVGNPLLPALHGGALGALLEVAAVAAALAQAPAPRLPRTIGLTVAFLRPAGPEMTWAEGRVVRRGRRVATVLVEAWQAPGGRNRPVATATVQLLLADDADGAG
jgi:uncharacterized protein (TIGR00369 family)